MRAVVQRVSRAQATVNGEVTGRIARGLLVLLGVAPTDTESDADYLADKIAGLRIFEDDAGKMNMAATDVKGQILVVSQFTLHGDVRRGKRPSFDAAAPPQQARKLYEHFHLGGWEEYLPRLQDYLAGTKGYETNKYQLTPEQRATIAKRWGEVIARYGYAPA